MFYEKITLPEQAVLYLKEKDRGCQKKYRSGIRIYYPAVIAERRIKPMAIRKIIKIEEKKCNGCGLCIPNCPEGAMKVIDGKARLISDLFCDGLGACVGHCPRGAITVEEREAEAYSEPRVMENIVKQGKNVIHAHLQHLKDHNEYGLLKDAMDFLKAKGMHADMEQLFPSPYKHREHIQSSSCPGSRPMDLKKTKGDGAEKNSLTKTESRLDNWPVQIKLVPVSAAYFDKADILIAADCVPFAFANFHDDLLKGKVLLIGCPKLDEVTIYEEKLGQIFKANDIKSITCAHMEVPCCYGFLKVIKSAINKSGKDIPFSDTVIGIKGQVKR